MEQAGCSELDCAASGSSAGTRIASLIAAASSAATPPDAVPITEEGAKGSPAVPAEASALTDEQGAVLDGNEIKKACLSSEEKSSEEKRGGRWGAQGTIGKGSAG